MTKVHFIFRNTCRHVQLHTVDLSNAWRIYEEKKKIIKPALIYQLNKVGDKVLLYYVSKTASSIKTT